MRQKALIVVAVLFAALSAAVALFAATSDVVVDGSTATTLVSLSTSTVRTSTSTTADPPPATSSATTTTPTTTTTTVATSTTSTTLALPPGTEQVTLASVTDGDTVKVNMADGTVEKVRLIGINSTESGECFAEEANASLRSLLDRQQFAMTSDVSDRDRYDRLLRYLWLGNGVFVNEAQVVGGFALARDYPPDSQYSSRLADAQRQAEADQAGMWAPDACGPETGSDLRITNVQYDAPGNDNENLNGEWVDIANFGVSAQTMSGWILKDESSSNRYRFPSGFTLDGDAPVRVYTGCGADTATDLFWCSDGAVWNNKGDTAFLLDSNGNIVDALSY